MINGNITQFLDTGWYNADAEIYYNGFIYWFEAQKENNSNLYHFWIDKWRVEKNDDFTFNTYCYSKDRELVEYQRVFSMKHNDLDFIKETCLKSPIFEGKSFWKVEKKLAWLDDSGRSVIINSIDDIAK